jgi:hypothetical protein
LFFNKYLVGNITQSQLALLYGVSRQTISKIIRLGRNDDSSSSSSSSKFMIKKPVNHRYMTEEYQNKRNIKLQDMAIKKEKRRLVREEIKKSRYEHKVPGNMGHMDLKLLPPILGSKYIKSEKYYLLSVVDDCTRKSYFEVILGKNQHSVSKGLNKILSRSSITFKSILSDNGKEFKGKYHQHQTELLLQKNNIKHYYTKVRRPQTNGKVERLNRTISEELLTKIHFDSIIHREAELRLYEYYYNHNRKHQGINNLTPNQKFTFLHPLKFLY